MIVVSGALVLVALVLLVMGVLGRDLPLVYGSIAVSTLSLLCLLVGILQRRGEPVPQDGDHLVPVHVPATSAVTGSETVAERQDAAAHTSTLSHDLLSRGRADDEESDSVDGDAQEQGWEGDLTDPQDDDGDDQDRYEDEDEPPQGGVRLVRVPQHLAEPDPEDGELDDGVDEGARRDGTVLVVPGRPRYHVEGCRYLYGKHPQGLDVADARDSGFVPCGVCKPDESLAAVGDPVEDTVDEAQDEEPLHDEEQEHEPEQDDEEEERDDLSLEESLFGEAVFGGPAQERDATRELPLVEAAEPPGAPQDVPDGTSGTSDDDLAERQADGTDAAASTADPAPEQEQEQSPAMTASGAPDDDPSYSVSESPAEQSPAEQSPAEEPAAAAAPVEEPPALEAAVTESPAAKAPAKRAPAKKAPAKRTPAKKAPARKAPARKAPAGKAPATDAAAAAAAPDGPPAAPAPAPSGPAVRRIRAVGVVTPQAPGAAPTVRRISATGARRPSPTPAPAPAPPGTSRTATPTRRTGQVVVVPDRPRFHLAQCRFVRDVPGATSLSRAAADRQGYVPCGVCKP